MNDNQALVLRMAQELGRRHLRVVRVYANDKRPVGLDWVQLATDDVDVLTSWFGNGTSYNIGVACGPQPSGLNLVVIDVDPKNGGLETWAGFVATYGEPPVTAKHVTPSLGFHLYFNSPVPIRNGKLGPGVDVRGDGGQVVVPPSTRVDASTGEILRYAPFEKGLGLWQRDVADMPEWLIALCEKTPIEPVERIDRPARSGEDPPDWLRRHWIWIDEVQRDGYEVVRQVGDDVYIGRPGRSSEHNAVIHLRSNELNAWSTEMPAPLRPSQVAPDGSIAWSPWDWYVVHRHGRDGGAARRAVLWMMGVGSQGAVYLAPSLVGDSRQQSLGELDELYLPDEFWGATALLSEVFRLSLLRQRTPDAVLCALLSMYATTIPMNIWVPPIVAARAPLNLYGCIVSISGGGKTSAMSVASELMGSPGNADIKLRQGLRSGEGLITKVLKPKSSSAEGVERAMNVGVHIHYDEGGALSKQANQTASTVMPYLNTAWSGAGIVGGARADSDLGFDAARVRITATIGVQYGIGANLFAGEAALLGFPQRLLFLSGDGHPAIQDVEMPEHYVEFEPLGLPFLAHHEFTRPIFVELPRVVRQEVWDWSKTKVAPLDGHLMNLRLRVATVLALMHGAGDADFGLFWDLSDQVIRKHCDVRHTLVASMSMLAQQRQSALGVADSQRAEAAYEYDLGRAVESLMTKLASGIVLSSKQIKDHFRSWTKRYPFSHHDVISRALTLGLVVATEGGYRRA